MKRIIFLLLILIPFLASAQKTTPGNYTYIAQKYEWDAGIFKGLGLPSGAGPAAFITGQVGRAGAVYYDSVGADAGMYIYDGTAWVLQGSPSAVSLPDEILSPGYVTYSGTGLTFYISPSVYRIDGIIYGTDQDSVTLATADPTDPRKDVIYLDTAGVQLLTGTPAEVATEPQLDAGQLKLTVADLAAGATVPTLTAQIVYDEGTESTVTNTGTTTNPNNTTNVFRLTKSLDVTDISNGDIIYYQIAGIPLAWDVTNISGLSMFIKLKAVMPSTGHLFVRLDVDATAVSTEAEIIINRNSLEWQAVTVPRSALGNLTSNSVTRVMMRYKRSVATVFSGFYLDYMHFQQGLTQPGTPGGVSTVTAAIPGWNTTGPTAGDVNLTLTPPGTRAQIMRGNATAETDSTVKYVGTVNSQTKSANGAVINTATNELILQEADPDDNGIVSAYDWRRLDTTANQTVHNLPSDGSSDSIMVNLDAFSTAFKRFKAGTNVTLTVNDSTIIVNSSGGGGTDFYATNGTLTSDRTITLSGNYLRALQAATELFLVDPTANNEVALLQAYNTTGGGNSASYLSTTTATEAQAALSTDFDGSSTGASVTLFADNAGSSVNYTADLHEFNGDLRIANTYRLRIGSNAGDLGSLANGDVFYNSTTNKFRAYENGALVDMIGSGTLLFDSLGAAGISPMTTWNNTLYARRISVTGGLTIDTTASGGLVLGGSFIGGSIASTQIAIGSGTNTIAGSSNFTWSSGLLTHSVAASFNPTFRMNDGDVALPNYSAAGFSPALDATTIFNAVPTSGTTGGIGFQGFTESGVNNGLPVLFQGTHGGTAPTTAAIRLDGYKWNGSTNRTSLGASEIALQVTNAGTILTTHLGNGNLGIGQVTPTAVLHLKAGTATASTGPLKFTSGTNLTTPEAGAMEYNGTSFFLSPSTTRFRIPLTDNSIPSNGQLAIGNGTNYTNATITEGQNIDITNGSGTITVAGATMTKNAAIENPTAAENMFMFRTPVAITVASVNAVLVGSATPSVTYNIAFGTDRTSATNVYTAGQTVTSTTTGAAASGVNDATIPADSWIWVTTSAQSGTVTQLNISLAYTQD